MLFFEECFDLLIEFEQDDFVVLLESDDFDLFVWVMGYGCCENLGFVVMVDKIVVYNFSKVC